MERREGGGKGINDEKLLKRDGKCPCDHPDRGGGVSGGEGGTTGWGDFNDEKPFIKWLRSVPKVQTNGLINASLVSFLLEMIFDEFCPLIFSHYSLRRLRSLIFLAWYIRVSVGST